MTADSDSDPSGGVNESERKTSQSSQASSNPDSTGTDIGSYRERPRFTLESFDSLSTLDTDENRNKPRSSSSSSADEPETNHSTKLVHSASDVVPNLKSKGRFHVTSSASIKSDSSSSALVRSKQSRFTVSKADDDDVHKSKTSASDIESAVNGDKFLSVQSEMPPKGKTMSSFVRSFSARIPSKARLFASSRVRAQSENSGMASEQPSSSTLCTQESEDDRKSPDDSADTRDLIHTSNQIKVSGDTNFNLRYPRMDWWATEDLPPRPKDFTILACLVIACCNPFFGVAGCVYAMKSEHAYKKGRYDESGRAAKLALILSVTGIVVTVSVTVILLAVFWPKLPERKY